MGCPIDPSLSKFHIPRAAFPYAHAQVRNMFAVNSPFHYLGVDTKKALEAQDFAAIMREWNFELIMDLGTGDCVGLTYTGAKFWDVVYLLKVIAQYVTAGSYLVFREDAFIDPTEWHMKFDGRSVSRTFPDPAEA